MSERATYSISPLQTWRRDRGLSIRAAANLLLQGQGRNPARAVKLILRAESGLLWPQDKRLRPIWQALRRIGRGDVEQRQIAWWEGV